MDKQLSSSLVLVWQVAMMEARHLCAPNIEPIHLLLGLTKSVDIDLVAIVRGSISNRDEILEECLREVRRLRTVFQNAAFDPMVFRRRMRRILDLQSLRVEQVGIIHRSPASRNLFTDAGQLSQLADGVIYPIHLLHAVLTTKDSQRDELFKELGVNIKRLKEAVWKELFNEGDAAKAEKVKWN